MALQVLSNNGVHPYVFAEAFRSLLVKRRGKFRNVMVCGPETFGKTFLVRSLSKLFSFFLNHSVNKYE